MYPELPPENALILVGVIPQPRDMEIARVLGWYRIPLRFAPKIIDVDYIAFYQTAAFGKEHQWRIETVAEVRGHELTTRGELLQKEQDHPRAKEEYYKIALGDLQPLLKPIPAGKWKRVTFLYTTGRLLASAGTIRDLVIPEGEERDSIWKSLQKRSGFDDRMRIDEDLFDLTAPPLWDILKNLTRR